MWAKLGKGSSVRYGRGFLWCTTDWGKKKRAKYPKWDCIRLEKPTNLQVTTKPASLLAPVLHQAILNPPASSLHCPWGDLQTCPLHLLSPVPPSALSPTTAGIPKSLPHWPEWEPLHSPRHLWASCQQLDRPATWYSRTAWTAAKKSRPVQFLLCELESYHSSSGPRCSICHIILT